MKKVARPNPTYMYFVPSAHSLQEQNYQKIQKKLRQIVTDYSILMFGKMILPALLEKPSSIMYLILMSYMLAILAKFNNLCELLFHF